MDQGKRKTGTPWGWSAIADDNKREANATRAHWTMHPIVTAPGVSDGSNRSRFPRFFKPCTPRRGHTLKQSRPVARQVLRRAAACACPHTSPCCVIVITQHTAILLIATKACCCSAPSQIAPFLQETLAPVPANTHPSSLCPSLPCFAWSLPSATATPSLPAAGHLVPTSR